MVNYIPNEFIQWHFASIANEPKLIEKIRHRVKIPDEVLNTSGHQLSADQYAELLTLTTKFHNQESFGQLSQPLGKGSFHMMCHACITCVTFEQALIRCIEFYRLLNPQIKWSLEKKGDTASVHFTFTDLDNEKAGYFVSFMMTIVWRWISWLINKTLPLTSVSFRFARPSFYKEIEHIYRQEIAFDQATNQFSFALSELRQPIKQSVSNLNLFLINVPECLLSHYQEEVSIKRQLKDFLLNQENLNQVTLTDAADYFCCSEQSLIRKLRAEGTKFKAQVDAIQKSRAYDLVTKTNLSNQQITAELGFNDPSVFYRKFKKWFNHTPSQIRQSPM
ncbi:MAG: AraC family transcriptional regulator ligand-binding domain-containing protein [Gammaproteobacteria bacterium]|nr:AraC family transcriptional regulator ligand-binding domain-containing protein [Gammaproteobacteria bacterium]